MTNQEIINNNLRNLLDPMQKMTLNSIKLDTGNSLEHELKKAEICYNLQKYGHSFVTEARLRTGGKPDILVLDIQQPIAYEIMKSEKDISITLKESVYHGIRIIKVKV